MCSHEIKEQVCTFLSYFPNTFLTSLYTTFRDYDNVKTQDSISIDIKAFRVCFFFFFVGLFVLLLFFKKTCGVFNVACVISYNVRPSIIFE